MTWAPLLLFLSFTGAQVDAGPLPSSADDQGGGDENADDDEESADDGLGDDAILEVDADGWIEVDDEDWESATLEGDYEADFETTILAQKGKSRSTGSAYEVGKEALERYEYDDIHRIVKQVPGVYVREEDGFGLRPNIGMRGANSERSAKITLLEDGILLGPAPYSAPAAYYFPLTTRLVGVEVFKGPAAIKHGPNTVGGAINMKTRPIPWGFKGGVDVAGGAFLTRKGHGWVGWGTEYFGFMLEGVQIASGGFKQLDGGGRTGFRRDDLVFKARVNNALDADWTHALEIKVGFQDEDSNETYLGLADKDFARTPQRRYRATQLARLRWRRLQLQAAYRTTWLDVVDVRVTAYRHDFWRRWTKANRFRRGPDLKTILENPDRGQSAIYYGLLTGALDAENQNQALLIGTNDRSYVSQGVQAVATFELDFWEFKNETEVGARLHQDQVERRQSEDGFLMRNGNLTPDGRGTDRRLNARSDALALATWIQHELVWRGLSIVPGLRAELIRTGFNDWLSGDEQNAVRLALLPGLGFNWSPYAWVSVFGGLHRGFSPVAPGQAPEVAPEDSWNAEAGSRVQAGGTRVEMVSFFNRYSNLTGTCTFVAGCADGQVGAQFNGGEVWIYGLEALFAHEVALPLGLSFRGDLVYTLTLSSFQSEFVSSNPEFGRVRKGDALAHVPVHQGTLMMTLGGRLFDFSLASSYVGAMRIAAGQGPIDPKNGTEPALVLDATANYNLGFGAKIYFTADNILNNIAVASRRPFGARAGKPRSFMLGFKYEFGQ